MNSILICKHDSYSELYVNGVKVASKTIGDEKITIHTELIRVANNELKPSDIINEFEFFVPVLQKMLEPEA